MSGSVRDLLVDTAGRLGSATEARWVLEHVLGTEPGAVVLARTDTAVGPEAAAAVEGLVARRLGGEPLQYVLGRWPFRTLELAVDRRVLIPRPETELVAGHALDELARVAADLGPDEPVVAADLGTGSGAIALSLAAEGPGRLGGRPLAVVATDASADALAVAEANRAATGLPVELVAGGWFEALPPTLAGRLHLVVSNPPYVSESEWAELDPVVRDHEPRGALVAGPTGTEAVDALLEAGTRWLAPTGVMVLEVAPHQADDAALRALVAGFDGVLVRNDLAGRARALVARRWG